MTTKAERERAQKQIKVQDARIERARKRLAASDGGADARAWRKKLKRAQRKRRAHARVAAEGGAPAAT